MQEEALQVPEQEPAGAVERGLASSQSWHDLLQGGQMVVYQDRVGGVVYAPRVSKCQEFLKPKQLSNKNDKHHEMQLPHLPPTCSVGARSQQNFLAGQPGAAPCLGQNTVLSLL